MRVEIYYNLHKHCLSVRNKGKVIAHVPSVLVKDASFVVQPAGRAKVLREKKKNVHAFVRGMNCLDDSFTPALDGLTPVEVTYNPYKYNSFVRRDNEQPIHTAKFAVIDGRRVTAFV